MSLYQRMSSPGFQSNVKNIGSPLMQQNQYGTQSPQMGGQFGGYMQQLEKQIGGLQNQIQAMSQRQPQQAAIQAAGTFSKEITPRTSTPFTQEHFDEMIASNSKLSQSNAPQYKSYEAYIDHMTKPRMTREEFDEMISRKPMLSSMAPQYKNYEAFLEHTKNRGRGRSRRYTYGPAAETSGSPDPHLPTKGPLAETPFAKFSPRYSMNKYGGVQKAAWNPETGETYRALQTPDYTVSNGVMQYLSGPKIQPFPGT